VSHNNIARNPCSRGRPGRSIRPGVAPRRSRPAPAELLHYK
ncbi:unnamed protein product, partial [Plutella xylostella]